MPKTLKTPLVPILMAVCLISGAAYAQENAQDSFKKGWDELTHDNYDGAIAEFEKTIELDPKFASAYDNLGNAFFFKGDYNNAILNYDKAIELMPDNAPTYDFQARAYFKTGQFDKAWEDVHKAKELGSTDPQLIEALIKYSGKDETNEPSQQKVLQDAQNNADMEDYKNLPVESRSCKQDSDCALGGVVCQYVPVNKDHIKKPIRTIQEMYMDPACSNIRDSGQHVSVACINNICQMH